MILFNLGRIVATAGADAELRRLNLHPLRLISRHQSGDFGDLDQDDKNANLAAIAHGGRILSAYIIDGVKFYVITEADYSSTCVLLAQEY